MTATTSRRLLGYPGRSNSAARTAIAWFGAIVAFAGVEHGIGEVFQGWRAADTLFIESWPDVAAFEIVSGEPALTIVPNLVIAGVVTVLVSLAFGAWAIWFIDRPRGWLVLLGLSAALLLVGGGLAPPVMGVILSIAAWRLHARPRSVGSLASRFGRSWPWFVLVGVVAYLCLVPGVVLASLVVTVPELVVYMLGATAFGCLILALLTAQLDDQSYRAQLPV